MPNYGDKKYWEKRYAEQDGTTFDWLEDYDSIKPILDELGINHDSAILNIGCGNSEFSEKMYQDGFINNFNIDICENVIEYMKSRNKGNVGMNFEVMDVRDMKFKEETFDLIVDKSTTDALLCGDHSFLNVAKMTKEVSRILKTGGYYLNISYGKPENRLLHFEREHLDFDIQIYTIKRQENKEDQEKIHYGYICKKLPDANEKLKNFEKVIQELEHDEIECEEEEEGNEGEGEGEEEGASRGEKGEGVEDDIFKDDEDLGLDINMNVNKIVVENRGGNSNNKDIKENDNINKEIENKNNINPISGVDEDKKE